MNYFEQLLYDDINKHIIKDVLSVSYSYDKNGYYTITLDENVYFTVKLNVTREQLLKLYELAELVQFILLIDKTNILIGIQELSELKYEIYWCYDYIEIDKNYNIDKLINMLNNKLQKWIT